jgi:hypothetical protein
LSTADIIPVGKPTLGEIETEAREEGLALNKTESTRRFAPKKYV